MRVLRDVNFCKFLKCKYMGIYYCNNIDLTSKLSSPKITKEDFLNKKLREKMINCPFYYKIITLINLNR